MQLKHKKIIAREGLIILLLITLMVVAHYLPKNILPLDNDVIEFIIFLSYPGWLILRFIIWAKNTLQTVDK